MPFPYIANEAGWMVTEVGRQPWIIYGLMRTAQASSPTVGSGETIFTLIGFAGMYFLLGVLFLYLVLREIGDRPVRIAATARRCRHEHRGFRRDRVHARRCTCCSTATISASPRSRRSIARTDRERAGSMAQHRTVLERQRGLADRRGRRALRALSRGVRRRRSRASICRSSSCSGC